MFAYDTTTDVREIHVDGSEMVRTGLEIKA
jgi:hypothetical protein